LFHRIQEEAFNSGSMDNLATVVLALTAPPRYDRQL
jgi:hypothetical protein